MAPQGGSKVDRGTVLGLIAVIISVVGVIGPVGAGGTSSRIVKVTSDKPATCPQGQICPWIPPETITQADILKNSLTASRILSVGTEEMRVPMIQRRSNAAQEIQSDAFSSNPTEALEFQNVVASTGGAAAPEDCEPIGNLEASSCVVVKRSGVYQVDTQVKWEGNNTGVRSIWGIRFDPDTLALDPNTVFSEVEPGQSYGAVGGQVVHLTYSIELEAGEAVIIAAGQNSGDPLDVLSGSTLSVTWTAPSPTP